MHPIDILDVGTGALVDALVDPNLQLINPVNMPHPLVDVIITGSSGHLYCWRPEVRERTRGHRVVMASNTQACSLPTMPGQMR